MKKKFIAIVILLAFLMSLLPTAFADEFHIANAYTSYSGGYQTSTRHHWTSYSMNTGGVVSYGSGIKVMSNATEVSPTKTTGAAYILSVYDVSPYVNHTHYKYEY